MNSSIAPKPIVGSQRFRVINAICLELSEQMRKKPDDFFTVFHARLSQVVDTSASDRTKTQPAELWKPVVDAAIFPKRPGGKVAGSPILLVFLDRNRLEYERVLTFLDNKGISYLFCTEEALLRKKEQRDSTEPLPLAELNHISENKPFNQSENQILTAISAAILRGDFSAELLLTGQTVLSAFTDFDGYSHDKYGNQTDSDLLLCTTPPVSIPLLAIEVDGPHHFSEDYWFKKKGSTRTALQQLDQEQKKREEKDEALRKAGIPVFHIRVDSSTKSILARHMSTITQLINQLIESIEDQGESRKKKYRYANSIVKRFLLAKDKAFSTNPELEDLIHIAPELISLLLRKLIDSNEQLGQLQAQINDFYEGQTPSTAEEAFDYPFAARNGLGRLHELSVDQLFNHLSCAIDYPEECSAATVAVEIQIQYRSSIGPPLQLASFSETVPWLAMGGHESDRFNQLLKRILARILGRTYFKRLPVADKQSWRAQILEHLSAHIDLAENESKLSEIRDRYDKNGFETILKDVDQRLRFKIRSIMERRGYVQSNINARKNPREALWSGRLIWIHEKTSRPECWEPAGERSLVSLEKLLNIFPVLDEMTQRAISKTFDDFLETQLQLYREIPIGEDDWAPLHEHIKILKKHLTPRNGLTPLG